ncbi:uncharacterized protein [Epargyreus clarus]|uniref:uncharacterized protein n=1 Tax=Epargyreus clarus TaxID=520877 RepID=UPI003C2F0695
MVVSCCIKGCKSKKYPGCKLSFHYFPVDENIRKKWLKVTNVKGSLTHKKICPLHFRSDDFIIKGTHVYLKPGTVPSYCTPPFKTEKDFKLYYQVALDNNDNDDKVIDNDDKVTDNDGQVIDKDDRVIDNDDKVIDTHIDNDDDYSYSEDSEDDDYEPDTEDEDDDSQDSTQSENIKRSVPPSNRHVLCRTKQDKCKCCLNEKDLKSMWLEHDTENGREVYGTMLVQCFALSWERPRDDICMTEYICAVCVRRLRDALSFRTELLAAQQLLRAEALSAKFDKLKRDCNKIENIPRDRDKIDVRPTGDEIEDIPTEYLNIDYVPDYNNMDIDKLCNIDNDEYNKIDCVDKNIINIKEIIRNYKQPKKLENLSNQEDQEVQKSEEAKEEDTDTSRKKRRLEMEYTAEDMRRAVNAMARRQIIYNSEKRFKVSRIQPNTIREEYTRSTELDPGEEHKPLKKEAEEDKHTANILTIMENSNATPIRGFHDGGYLCCFCDHQYPKLENLKAHTILCHDMETKKTFKVDTSFVELDVSYLTCNICESNIDCLESLLSHFVDRHRLRIHTDVKNNILPFKFESDELRCAVCYDLFDDFEVLQTHLYDHYPNVDCLLETFLNPILLPKMSASSKKGPVFDSGECRCCGATKRCRLLNVEYEFLGQKEVYSDMFVDCFGLLLSHLDGEERERMICATCVTRLREARDFRSQVLRCEEKLLRARIQTGDNHDDQSIKKEIEIDLKEEREQENNNQDEDGQDDTDDLMNDEHIERRSSTDSEHEETIEDKEWLRSKRREVKQEGDVRNRRKSVKDHLKARKEMLISMKRTKEKLKKVLRKERTSEIVRLEGNRIQKSTKAFSNTVTIVENSYVCPFQSIFNDFYCDYCREKFTHHEELRDHYLVHDPSTYKDVIMDSMRRLGRKKTQLDVQRIDCRLCPEPINDIETFKAHITNVHGKMLYPVENEFLQFRVTPNNLECIECGHTFTLFQALKKHMAEHFGTYTCDICGTHFFNESYLIAHQKNHDTSTKQELYTCEECGRSFKLKYSRDMHVATQHRKEAAFQCIKCDEMFFSSRLRFKHMMEVHGERSTFQCSKCDRIYDNRKTLLDHMRRIHVKTLKHKCSMCERRFYLPSMLKDHMAVHTGEKNFKCDYCGKSYPRLKSLKVHLQSHAAVKKYKCAHCSASYGQNVSLKNHMKRQHQRCDMEGMDC